MACRLFRGHQPQADRAGEYALYLPGTAQSIRLGYHARERYGQAGRRDSEEKTVDIVGDAELSGAFVAYHIIQGDLVDRAEYFYDDYPGGKYRRAVEIALLFRSCH